MYAYKQSQIQTTRIHTHLKPVPSIAPKLKQVKQKKKKNIFVEFIRTVFTLTLLSAFGIYIFPTSFNNLVKNVILPHNINTVTGYQNVMLKKLNPAYDTSVNMYSISKPMMNYIHNDFFNNSFMLSPVITKKHSEVTTMYHTGEMAPLKNSLLNLAAQYKEITPAIYVWEYDQGKYVEINSDKQYPAASIIKIPVLVRMFKSIEANQFTIYDEMKMQEQYRSSGSGELQYKPANLSYTMDYLAKTMIQDSDNTSTNMIMSKMGGMNDVNAGLRDWGLSKTYVRTWLPDLKGTNKTTASEMAKILYNLDNPGFLNVNSREYIIDYLSHVKNNRLIQAGLGDGALFIHKTGDIGRMLGDAGIVYAPNGKKYIVVILANRPYNSPSGKDFIVKASSLIYNYIVNN